MHIYHGHNSNYCNNNCLIATEDFKYFQFIYCNVYIWELKKFKNFKTVTLCFFPYILFHPFEACQQA